MSLLVHCTMGESESTAARQHPCCCQSEFATLHVALGSVSTILQQVSRVAPKSVPDCGVLTVNLDALGV